MMKKILMILALMGTLTAEAQRMDDVTEHSKYIKVVDEYVPAPGQFINTMPPYEEGDDAYKMAQKCTEYLANNQRDMVCLGGYGGYITFHFDHSIANVEGQRDFFIEGNAIKDATGAYEGGSSEPGIVMVSQDVNMNGIADDPWYELSGSADQDSIGKVLYDYEIVYSQNPMGDIPWTDNKGHSGVIERLERYSVFTHPQEFYPLWLEDKLTFSGTLLPNNAINTMPSFQYGNYILMFLREGYVDNKPNTDSEANSFDISWAVDANRQSVNLQFIDFIRVYTAVNQKCGRLGETSTEIMGAEDLHLDTSIQRIKDALAGVESIKKETTINGELYDLQGRKVKAPGKGLYIKNGKKYIIK